MVFLDYQFNRYAELAEKMQVQFKALRLPSFNYSSEMATSSPLIRLQERYYTLRSRIPYYMRDFNQETKTWLGFLKSWIPTTRAYTLRAALTADFYQMECLHHTLMMVEVHLTPVMSRLKELEKQTAVAVSRADNNTTSLVHHPQKSVEPASVAETKRQRTQANSQNTSAVAERRLGFYGR